jgi:hypothetical protein
MARTTKQKNMNTAVSIAVLDFAGASAKRDRRPVLRKSRNRGAISFILKALASLSIFDTANLLLVPVKEQWDCRSGPAEQTDGQDHDDQEFDHLDGRVRPSRPHDPDQLLCCNYTERHFSSLEPHITCPQVCEHPM